MVFPSAEIVPTPSSVIVLDGTVESSGFCCDGVSVGAVVGVTDGLSVGDTVGSVFP